MISASFIRSLKLSAIVVLFLCVKLDYSNAQSVRLKNSESQFVEGAVVIFSTLNDRSKGAMVFSNNKGEAWVLGIDFPMVRSINCMGYLVRTDTVHHASVIEELVLTKASKGLGEVIITGNHTPGYQRDAVVSVQVLNRDDIEKRGAVTVKDLLSQELNMRMSFDPALGSSLSMQGTGGEHIKILMDGVPMIGRQNGNIDLGQINLNNIERVEVVRGPMSVLYGTDALGGVINLISKKNQKKNWSASSSAFYESTGQYNVDLDVGASFKSTSLSVSGARNFFDGFDPNNTNTRSQLWNPREQYVGDVKVIQSIGSLKLTLHSSWFNEKMIDKADVLTTPYYAYANDQYYYTTRFNNYLTAEKQFKNFTTLNLTTAYSQYEYVKNTFRKNMVDLTEQLTPDLLDDDTTKFNAVFVRATHAYARPDAKWSVFSGIDVNDEVGQGRRIDGEEHRMRDVAAYISFDFKPVDYLVFRPAVRAIYNSQFNAPLIPSLSILYRAGNAFSFRTSISKGYRAPSLKEQYLYFVDNGIHNVQGNPNLQAETSTQFTANVEYKKTFNDAIFTIEPGFFFNEIHNKISLVQYDLNSTLYTYVNVDEFTTRGFDFKTKWAQQQFSLQAGVAYTGLWATFNGDVSQPDIAWYPEVNAAADYTIKKTKTSLSVFWKLYGERPVFLMQSDGSLGRFTIDSYKMMDASVRQVLIKDRIIISAGVRNIFNVSNIRSLAGGGVHSGDSGAGTPVGMGTSVFTKLTFNLK